MAQDTTRGGRNFGRLGRLGPSVPAGRISVHPTLYNLCVRVARTRGLGISGKTLVLLGVLGAVSVALLGEYFWIALLLCALLYAATSSSGWLSIRVRKAASVGSCALLLVMALVIADRGGILEAGIPDEKPQYTARVLEEGAFANGAEGLRIRARTDDTSEASWRELASEIARENGYPDFLWVDVTDEATGDTRAVVAVFSTEEAADALALGSVGPSGGEKADGVYVFGPSDLERLDYSPSMTVLKPT